jgi:CheY-like chemotaxis protein
MQAHELLMSLPCMGDLIVIDDDIDFVDAFVEILRFAGHSVRFARNGQDGLDRIAEQRPELVLSDIEMPILGGPEMIYRLLLRDLGDERIPVLLISAAPNLKDVAAEIGSPYYLSKPFDIEPLLTLIDIALVERAPPSPKYFSVRTPAEP